MRSLPLAVVAVTAVLALAACGGHSQAHGQHGLQ